MASVMATVLACTHTVTAETEKGVSLFNGKNLDGWRVTEENSESFTVEDGAIKAHGPRAHIFYDGPGANEFEDFELSLKVMTKPGSNSGVFFHTVYQKENWPKIGLEAQVNATQGDPRKTGSLYNVAEIRVYDSIEKTEMPVLGVDQNSYSKISNPYSVLSTLPHKDNEWVEYIIRVEDQTVLTYVNGKLFVRWKQPEDWSNENQRLGKGTFAFQAHDPASIAYFKDIYVKTLD